MTRNEKEVILRSVISTFCIGEKMFTSVEIANHLKRLGVWMRNRDVSKFLHANVPAIGALSGVEYKSDLIFVDANGRNYGATVYFPDGFDPEDYMARDLRAITPNDFKDMHGENCFVEDEDADDSETKVEVKEGDVVFFFPK